MTVLGSFLRAAVDKLGDHAIDGLQSFIGVGAEGAALVLGFVKRTEVDGEETGLLALQNVKRIAGADAVAFDGGVVAHHVRSEALLPLKEHPIRARNGSHQFDVLRIGVLGIDRIVSRAPEFWNERIDAGGVDVTAN